MFLNSYFAINSLSCVGCLLFIRHLLNTKDVKVNNRYKGKLCMVFNLWTANTIVREDVVGIQTHKGGHRDRHRRGWEDEWSKIAWEQRVKEGSTIQVMIELNFKNWVCIYHTRKRKTLQDGGYPVKVTGI